MTQIHTPVEGFTGHIAGVTFADGVGNTDDEAAIAYFERQGYGVGSESPEDPDGDKGPAANLADRTVAELKEYAQEKGIDLQGATKKDDLLAAIELAATANPEV